MTVTRTAVPMATVLSIRDKWSEEVIIRFCLNKKTTLKEI